MDQFRVFAEKSLIYFPLLTLIIGFVGSTHCLGMCGAISLNCSGSKKSNYAYQLGRLSGYLIVALIMTTVGQFLLQGIINESVTLVASILIGGALIWMGLRPVIGIDKKLSFNAGSFIYKKLLNKKDKSILITYLIGSSSIFLPCGLIYGLLLPLMALKSIELSLLSVVTFWIGTLPIMAMAPYLIQKLLIPFRKKAPVFISFCLVFMGITVITSRVITLAPISSSIDSNTLICK